MSLFFHHLLPQSSLSLSLPNNSLNTHPSLFQMSGNDIPPEYYGSIEKGFKEAANSGALIGAPVEVRHVWRRLCMSVLVCLCLHACARGRAFLACLCLLPVTVLACDCGGATVPDPQHTKHTPLLPFYKHHVGDSALN